jgi:hypothetical protein
MNSDMTVQALTGSVAKNLTWFLPFGPQMKVSLQIPCDLCCTHFLKEI